MVGCLSITKTHKVSWEIPWDSIENPGQILPLARTPDPNPREPAWEVSWSFKTLYSAVTSVWHHNSQDSMFSQKHLDLQVHAGRCLIVYSTVYMERQQTKVDLQCLEHMCKTFKNHAISDHDFMEIPKITGSLWELADLHSHNTTFHPSKQVQLCISALRIYTIGHQCLSGP